jgi:membrane protease YdiL (CAAX protease family)
MRLLRGKNKYLTMNDFRSFIRNSRPLTQFFLLMAVTIFAIGLLGAIGLFACETLYGADWEKIQEYLNDPTLPGAPAVLKVLQLFNTLGIFLIPAMIFSQLLSPRPLIYLRLNKKTNAHILIAVIVLFIAFTPITDALAFVNEQLSLPAFLSGFETDMRNASENSQALMGAFISMDSFGDFLFNIFLMALLPALGEEFFFRGVIQRLLLSRTRNVHVAVWVTGFTFAIMHQQFFAILPLLVLGALLGYLKEWTGSLWASIIAHFVNNASIVVVMYFADYNMSDISEITPPELIYVLPALLISGGLIFYFYQNRVAAPPDDDDLEDELTIESE